MARSIWTGSLSFGLVNVPVSMYSATEDRGVHFNQFQAGTSDRIRYKRVNERTGEEVPYADIVRGVEVEDGEYVILDPDEIETVEQGPTRSIEVTDFVDLADIDPIYFQKAYYLAPTGKSAPRPYALLHSVMQSEQKVAIATFVMRGKQHLCAVRPTEDVLMLETLFFSDEIRNPVSEIDSLPVDTSAVTDKELAAAKMLVESMTAEWAPEQYKDTYGDQLHELIERKRKDQTIIRETPAMEPTKVVDLMEALRASVDNAAKKRAAAAEEPEKKPAAKKKPARKAS